MYFLIDWNLRCPLCTNKISFYEACICFLDKKYMMAATEELLSDWLKEDIIIVLHDVFDNIAFCLEKYVFKTKLM